MTITRADAARQAAALDQAAEASPVRQYRSVLSAQANEWRRAVADLDLTEGDGVIELAGTLVPSMRIVHPDVNQPEDGLWRKVLRRTNTAGFSFELENPSYPKPIYRSFSGPSSPVVVKS